MGDATLLVVKERGRIHEEVILLRDQIVDRHAPAGQTVIGRVFHQNGMTLIGFQISPVLVPEIRRCLTVSDHFRSVQASDAAMIGGEDDSNIFLRRQRFQHTVQ